MAAAFSSPSLRFAATAGRTVHQWRFPWVRLLQREINRPAMFTHPISRTIPTPIQRRTRRLRRLLVKPRRQGIRERRTETPGGRRDRGPACPGRRIRGHRRYRARLPPRRYEGDVDVEGHGKTLLGIDLQVFHDVRQLEALLGGRDVGFGLERQKSRFSSRNDHLR